MAIPTNAIMQLSFRADSFGQRIRHVRNFRLRTGGTGPSFAQDFQDAFIQAVKVGGANTLATPWLAALSAAVELKEIRAQIIYPTRSAYSFLTVPAGQVGGRAATGVLTSDAAIEASSREAGRNQVAVYKIGPIATTDVSAGLIVAGLNAFLLTYSATFTAEVTTVAPSAAVWYPCIYHRQPKMGFAAWDEIYEAGPIDNARGKTTRTLRRGE